MRMITKRTAVILHDLFIVFVAFGLAYFVRYDFQFNTYHLNTISGFIPIVLITQGLVLWWSRLYRGVWRFASVPDLWNIVRAAAIGGLATTLALFLFNRLEGVPRTTLALYPMFLVLFLGGPRLAYRLWKDRRLKLFNATDRKRVLILGAGRAGEMLARDMIRDEEYLPIGFLDDNSKLKDAKVHGIPILGQIVDLSSVAEDYQVEAIVIAIPSATNTQMQRVVDLCEQTGVTFRTLPRLQDMMAKKAPLKELRQVSIDDLLGRDPVTLDWNLISDGLAGKTVLVSGGGGSIGSELCRQIARLGPKSLIVFEKSEFNLYKTELELKRGFPNLELRVRLGDVCDEAAVEHVMDKYQPDIVFHAAAYKHVPMLQHQIREAVRNNVVGTKVLACAADHHKCEKFVMISTDKAVNPTNIMGATKRTAEIFCQNLNKRSDTDYITVRFGNVLGSTGSVVPLFKKQIEQGGPVTVTHPNITRYFMTIPEACQLIMQAGVMGLGGEIFVLDMGEPVKISYLAEQMIRLSGKEPGREVEIVYTGLRPGEKLFEELFHEQENLAHTRHEKILLARSRDVEWDILISSLNDIEKACVSFNELRLNGLIKELVPEMKDTDQRPVSNVVPISSISEGVKV